MSTSEFAKCEVLSNIAHEVPESEYTRRLCDREQQLAQIGDLHQRLWIYLIAAALACILASWAVLLSHLASALWLLLPSIVVLSIHSLIKNARIHNRVQEIVRFYELGIARLHHRWQGRGVSGEQFTPDNHPYASDLDLFGTGSLFELLCTARTAVGRATLANWLLYPSDCEEVGARQAAVAELHLLLDLQEEWASVGGRVLEGSGASVRDWAEAPAIAFPFYARALAIILPICLVALSLLAGAGVFGHHWPWLGATTLVGLEALLAGLFLNKTRLTAANIVLPSFELELLAPLLYRFETLNFRSPLLKSLQLQITASASLPSKQIRLLRLWAWLLNLRQIEYFALLSSPILWGTNLAICIERWRQRNREGLARWLDSLGQFEALLCLARHYYENPDHTFPLLKRESSSLFQAEALGHPLLERQTCVRCEMRLGAESTQLIMVSGSNMSGKSTLLRSVGLNSVLALAGAPVRAARLQISPLQIACSISVHDSLPQSKSRFQAEVERLKWILDLSRTSKVLFLLDEMLGGTNSSDRLFGARAVIEQLTANNAIGLVTTHDLAVTEVVQALDGRAINVHFEEQYANGEMRFDYRMRPGVLTRTNGVNIMTALGLLCSPDAGATPLEQPK